jgi:hypothetical protein
MLGAEIFYLLYAHNSYLFKDQNFARKIIWNISGIGQPTAETQRERVPNSLTLEYDSMVKNSCGDDCKRGCRKKHFLGQGKARKETA